MTVTDKPKVSIGMPVYNGELYISEAIESVLSQTYQDFELIVSDNCSTDGTPEIVQNFNDPRIRYTRNKQNIGVVPNFNRVVALSRGEYFCLWAHDDVMLPDNLERKVAILDQHENVGFVHSDAQLIDSHGRNIDKRFFIDSRTDYINNGIDVFNRYILRMHQGASIFLGAVLTRKACFDRLGAFNPLVPNACDSEMWMKFALFYDVACVGKPLVKYRIHQSMTSTSISQATGLNLKGIQEHFLATQIILKTYNNRIANLTELQKKVKQNFAAHVLKTAKPALMTNSQILSCLKAAMKFYSPVILQNKFWKLLIKNFVAPLSSVFSS